MFESHKKYNISVVVPVYRSQDTLMELHNRLVKVLNGLRYSYEIIFVDDGSPDLSWRILKGIYLKGGNVQIIKLSQNFGQHNALICGFSYANGNYIITIDDDLQNSPEEIPKLINKLEQGYDFVYGEYEFKRHAYFRNLGSTLIQMFYKKIFKVADNLTAFRIIRREIIQEIIKYNKNYVFIDGLLAWQTKNIGYIKVRHDPRKKGKSGYTMGKLFLLSLNMLTNYSIIPLQMASIIGFLFSFLGFAIAIFIILKKILFGIPVTGFASLIASITIFSGVQLITIGIIGEYVGRIHLNINQKPQYTVAKRLVK